MLDEATTATDWVRSFGAALASGEAAAAAALLGEECWWRDLLAFTGTIRTIEGRPAVARMLEARLGEMGPAAFSLAAAPDGPPGEVWFTFETRLARCRGIARLSGGRARTLLTAMEELIGHEEAAGPRRPLGARHEAARGRPAWADAREERRARIGAEAQPYALIVGGGQGGLALAARLEALGVPALVVERRARIGDSWRHRYRSLVLHDPVWYDHMPYLPFPDTWPVFTPKDRMGDWLEAYASVMDLDCWTASEVRHAAFDDAEGVWTVDVARGGEPVRLRPRHLVFATGAYGPPREIDLPGADAFAGTLIHSSAYRDGAEHAGRRCVVIGSGSSAHDVALDLWEAGAGVTMAQRSPTTVVRSDTLMELGFGATYSEEALARGVTTEVADLRTASVPFALLPDGQRPLYEAIRERDRGFYERLAAAGQALDFGEDDSGLMMKALRTGSGYYIDVGASEAIADGRIAVRTGPVERLTETGVVVAGEEVPADLVVACTGYQSMNEWVARVVSREVADRVGPCWGLGSGVRGDPGPWRGELRNMWKPTAQRALWFHGGNLALSRFYSKLLALQLKARMEGLPLSVLDDPGASRDRAEGARADRGIGAAPGA